MLRGAFRHYSFSSAGTYPAEKRRGGLMYQDFDRGLAGERTARMRQEVERNRLDARLAKAARSDEGGVARVGRGRGPRGCAERSSATAWMPAWQRPLGPMRTVLPAGAGSPAAPRSSRRCSGKGVVVRVRVPRGLGANDERSCQEDREPRGGDRGGHGGGVEESLPGLAALAT